MAYFSDLSDYTYHSMFHRPGTKNVGWLDRGYDFNQMEPDEELLGLIWDYCTVSVAPMRGLHSCQFCHESSIVLVTSERNGKKFLLGSAEIRVFSKRGEIYAAPNLIYHYVSAHCYRPPEGFIAALKEGPRPPSREYITRLSELGLEWDETPVSGRDTVRFRFERTADGVKIVYE